MVGMFSSAKVSFFGSETDIMHTLHMYIINRRELNQNGNENERNS